MVVKSGIKKDQEISAAELKKLKSDAHVDKAYDRTLRYLAIRPRSQWEIEDYLKRKGYEEEIISAVVEKITKLGMIDDQAFARQWVEWRMNSRPRSINQLRAELLQKRIDREIIKGVLEGVDEDAQLEQLNDIINRKSRLSQYQDKQKLIAYLARQGFPYHLIKRSLSED